MPRSRSRSVSLDSTHSCDRKRSRGPSCHSRDSGGSVPSHKSDMSRDPSPALGRNSRSISPRRDCEKRKRSDSKVRSRSGSCGRSRSRSHSRSGGRSRSRGHSRSRGRSHSRDRTRSRSRNSRSRDHHKSRERSKRRSHSRSSSLKQALHTILSRLNAIEESSDIVRQTPQQPASHSTPQDVNNPSTTQSVDDMLTTLNPIKPHTYEISNFDPAINDIEVWCEDVERAKLYNNWNDYECLARVSNYLIGDAKAWFSGWNTNDRSWTNFKLQFKPLCPHKLDYANILFEVINSTSDDYASYAEYARRSLLRLRIVKGLSDELMVQIVVRGISDAHVRAEASNANLTTDNLISFLSVYVKPFRTKNDTHATPSNSLKRKITSSDIKCFKCGANGHKSFTCSKKLPDNSSKPSGSFPKPTCQFCDKIGHLEEKCFIKKRLLEAYNQTKVNVCTETAGSSTYSEVKCHKCGQTGHKGNTCPKKKKALKNEPSEPSGSFPMPPVTCQFCKNIGHTEKKCFAKKYLETQNKVKLLKIKKPKGSDSDALCFTCGKTGHKSYSCRKNPNLKHINLRNSPTLTED